MKKLQGSLLLLATCLASGCGVNGIDLAEVQLASDPDTVMGYSIGRNPLAIYRIHHIGPNMTWTAAYLADLPANATAANIGIGGLAAHPTDDETLYLMIDRGLANGAEIYAFNLREGTWSLVKTFNPAGDQRYWGFGSLCNGKLTSVSREYTTSSSVDGTFISFDVSTPTSTTTLFTAEAFALADNAADYETEVPHVFGRDASDDLYATPDGSTYYTYSGISEAWLTAAMANRIKFDGYSCGELDYIVAGADSSSEDGPSPVYAVKASSGTNSVALTYYDMYSEPQPNVVDFANIPGWCSNPPIDCK